MAVATQRPGIGELLRSWRQRRSLTQLELSLGSDVSARHLSFIETGRARPSREMVVHLAERLEVPLRDRNELLLAAGYAPLYGERPLDAEEMTPVRRALDRFLRAHEPYPAVVVDRHWTLVTANDAAHVLTDGVAPDLLEPPANGLRILLHPRGVAPRIANLAEYSAEIMRRLRRRAAITGDGVLESLWHELAAYPGVELTAPPVQTPGADIVLPLRLRQPAGELTFLSTISTFGTAVDITLAELAIEAFYPANAETATAMLREIAPEA
jgi:transcriptional regulator with XRE-family HTH domain